MKKCLALIALGLGTAFSLPSLAQTESKVQQVQPQEQGIWIDVRSPEEFSQGHLSGAINIPHNQIAEKISQLTDDKSAPIHLYCRSGRRAEEALGQLKAMGYTNLTNHGGYQDLLEKGYK
ncbi:rhodanese-like domain-containing protein [Pasteurellaceae bacterium RH1A]|nr:rhodanese-like domain-containing protein [Pasteurellaceae bacterium RH1A]